MHVASPKIYEKDMTLRPAEKDKIEPKKGKMNNEITIVEEEGEETSDDDLEEDKAPKKNNENKNPNANP